MDIKMLRSCVKIFWKYWVFEKFQQAGNLGLHILSQLPWGPGCQKSKISPLGVPYTHPARKVTLQSELQGKRMNDPRGYEIRPSIYYRPESISNGATQLVKKHYPHPSTLLFLCSYVGHGTENSMENLPGKIWKLQLRIAGLPFLHKLSHERQGEVIGFKTWDHPNRGFHRWGNICKESRDWFMVVHPFFCRENEHF